MATSIARAILHILLSHLRSQLAIIARLDLNLSYFDAESFDISTKASCPVVVNCAGKMIVEFFCATEAAYYIILLIWTPV